MRSSLRNNFFKAVPNRSKPLSGVTKETTQDLNRTGCEDAASRKRKVQHPPSPDHQTNVGTPYQSGRRFTPSSSTAFIEGEGRQIGGSVDPSIEKLQRVTPNLTQTPTSTIFKRPSPLNPKTHRLWQNAKREQERSQRRVFARKKDNPFAAYQHDPNSAESNLVSLSLTSRPSPDSIIPNEGLRSLSQAYNGERSNYLSLAPTTGSTASRGGGNQRMRRRFAIDNGDLLAMKAQEQMVYSGLPSYTEEHRVPTTRFTQSQQIPFWGPTRAFSQEESISVYSCQTPQRYVDGFNDAPAGFAGYVARPPHVGVVHSREYSTAFTEPMRTSQHSPSTPSFESTCGDTLGNQVTDVDYESGFF